VSCRPSATRRPRIEEVAARRLVEKFSREPDQQDGAGVHVDPSATGVAVDLADETHELTRAEARALRDELSEALTRRREFVRTAGVHREDGRYVVERRGADSSGHRKVFGAFEHLRRLYDRMPDRFTAEDVGRSGLTGGRRHMVLCHFAEHPAFDCELDSRQPLTVEKRDSGSAAEIERPPAEVTTAGD
jgi:hypothetical protein